MTNLYRLFWNDYEEETIGLFTSYEKAEEALKHVRSKVAEYRRTEFNIDIWPADKIPEWSVYK